MTISLEILLTHYGKIPYDQPKIKYDLENIFE